MIKEKDNFEYLNDEDFEFEFVENTKALKYVLKKCKSPKIFDQLIGILKNFLRLLKSRKEIFDEFEIFNSNTELFSGELFLGNGEFSSQKVFFLHERLQEAINYLGYQQQNGGMGTKFDEEFHEEAQKFKETVIWDIIAALGMKGKFMLAADKNMNDPKVNFGASF